MPAARPEAVVRAVVSAAAAVGWADALAWARGAFGPGVTESLSPGAAQVAAALRIV